MKTSSWTIRDARPEEFDETARLLTAAYQQYAGSMPESAWENYLADIVDVGSRRDSAELIVAEADGRLAGTVTLYLDGGAYYEEGGWPPGWAGIRLLAVHPDYRGLGLSRALMEECIRRCREKGIVNIGLHTPGMMSVAQGLYERMGFKRIPEYDFHPRPEVTVMAYRLEL
jgi:GNAT superfamily N-acetyltransferase